MKIKAMPKTMLPREKALKYGVDTLNIQELLAIILRSGVKENSVMEIAEKILERYPSMHQLQNASMLDLLEIPGISKVKALEILSVMEVAKRINAELFFESDNIIDDEYILINYLIDKIGGILQEQVLIVYLNNRNQVINDLILFKGDHNTTNISIPLIIKKGLMVNAKKIIVAHNHPSGCCYPSEEDLIVTNKIEELCSLVGMKVVDHIIVTSDDFFKISELKK